MTAAVNFCEVAADSIVCPRKLDQEQQPTDDEEMHPEDETDDAAVARRAKEIFGLLDDFLHGSTLGALL